jgi:hypothetical protein
MIFILRLIWVAVVDNINGDDRGKIHFKIPVHKDGDVEVTSLFFETVFL